MTAHDAAVRAVAEALDVVLAGIDYTQTDYPGVGWWETSTGADFGERKLGEIPAAVLAALATSADVRAGLVAAVNAAEGWYEPEGARTSDGEPIPGIRVWPLVDAVLAALGGAAPCTHESSTGVDQDFGPDKVWACDGCGWRHRTVVEDGLARDVDA